LENLGRETGRTSPICRIRTKRAPEIGQGEVGIEKKNRIRPHWGRKVGGPGAWFCNGEAWCGL